MRLLITGGAGYIGSHLLAEMLPLDHEILVIDNFSNGKREALNRVKQLSGDGFQVKDLDLCNTEALKVALNEFKPEAVIHLAGLKAVGESFQVPLQYYEKNVNGTIQLLRAMDSSVCKIIIFSSSATVYSAQDTPINELQTVCPPNPYGRTKYFIEQMIKDWAQTDKQKSAVVLRYFNPVGAHISGKIGEDPINVPSNLMPIIGQTALGHWAQLDIFGDDYNTPDGTAIRDYIHVLDLVKGHAAALNYAGHSSGVETFNLGTGKGYSVLDVVRSFEIANNLSIPYQVVGRRSGDTVISVADTKKAQKILGWKTQYDIISMCEDAWRWQSQNPLGYGNDCI